VEFMYDDRQGGEFIWWQIDVEAVMNAQGCR